MGIGVVLAAGVAGFGLRPAAAAGPTVITVNTTADPAGPGCTGGTCSLRQALAAATGITAQIGFSQGGVYQLSPSLGELHVTGTSTNIWVSPPQRVAIDAQGASRVLEVDQGAVLRLDQVTIENGADTSGMGGGILNRGALQLFDGALTGNTTSASSIAQGGAVANLAPGILTISQEVVSGNVATATDSAEGGAIFGTGALNFGFGDVISGNTAHATGASGVARGGGIYDASAAPIQMVTVDHNAAIGNQSEGGGIWLDGGGELRDLTVAFNSAGTGAGIDAGSGGGSFSLLASTLAQNQGSAGSGIATSVPTTVYMSILNDTAADECAVLGGGSITSQGYNIDAGSGCGLTDPTDQDDTDAQLGPLQDNGGSVTTMSVPSFGAASHGPADCSSRVSNDERNIVRPQRDTCYIGAFEDIDEATTTSVFRPPTSTGYDSPPTLLVDVNAHIDYSQYGIQLGGGTVAIEEAGRVLAGTPLTPVSPQVSITLPHLPVGLHTLTADYLGDLHHKPSASVPFTLNVNVQELYVTVSPDPAFVGHPVTITAHLSPPDVAGPVRFDYPGGTQTVVLNGGTGDATVTATLPFGTDRVQVQFSNGPGQYPAVAYRDVPVVPAPYPPTAGYRMVASDGGLFDFGLAPFEGSQGGQHLNQPIVGMAGSRDGRGYWMVAGDGGVFSFGAATFHGSMGGKHLNQPIVGMAATPSGNGYWLVASDGGIFPFGDAVGYGSTGGIRLNQPIVGMAATPDGGGYWLVASDGGIFPFGDAAGYGSTGSIHLNQPIVAMAATPSGHGYWLVASDGGVFCFGDAGYWGSTGGLRLNKPIVGIAAAPAGDGYWLVASDGGVFNFGDAGFYGSEGGTRLVQPIVGAMSTAG